MPVAPTRCCVIQEVHVHSVRARVVYGRCLQLSAQRAYALEAHGLVCRLTFEISFSPRA
jgi:hypothetical protein